MSDSSKPIKRTGKSGVFFIALLTLGDAILIFGSLLISFWARFHTFIEAPKGIPSFAKYLRIYPLATIVILIAFRYFGLYKRQWSLLIASEIGRITRAVTAGMVTLIIMTFIIKEETVTIDGSVIVKTIFTYSTGVWLISMTLMIFLISLWRKIFGWLEILYFRKRGLNKRLLLIGTNDRAEQVCRGISKNPQLCYEIVGAVATENPVTKKKVDGVDVIGMLSSAGDLIKQHSIDEVILCVTDIPHEVKSDLILQCEREMVDFRLVPDLFEVLTSNVEVVGIDGVPLMGLRSLPLDSAWNRFVKRAFDIGVSVIGMILASPILLIASILIKRSSPGPVFYRQVRCGEDGREFVLYKLRTMKEDAEKESGPVMALKDDPRKTPVGRFLRKYNIDELPQLYNVFKGNMSIVGPRPERPHFIEQFKYQIPRYMSRHHIKCGITGWAQVHGLIQDTSLEERIKYDIYYMENWSLLLDIKIILMTIFTKKEGY